MLQYPDQRLYFFTLLDFVEYLRYRLTIGAGVDTNFYWISLHI